jgi:hypothetical protein
MSATNEELAEMHRASRQTGKPQFNELFTGVFVHSFVEVFPEDAGRLGVPSGSLAAYHVPDLAVVYEYPYRDGRGSYYELIIIDRIQGLGSMWGTTNLQDLLDKLPPVLEER